jgi:hypothetical protein
LKISQHNHLLHFSFRFVLRFVTLVIILSGLLAQCGNAQSRIVDPALTVHEWGTFTSVAGVDGLAVEWSPLSGPNLPGFVEHFRTEGFKVSLRGTVRMETPVLYFYSPRSMTVSVQVAFANGLFTEWYPHARVTPETAWTGGTLSGTDDATLTWKGVSLEPGAATFLRETSNSDSHYYAARETSATPLRVNSPKGNQHEKFLFYRGVSAMRVPIAAQIDPQGRLLVRPLIKAQIPAAILFERRGDKVGYRLSRPLQEITLLDFPELTSSVESLYADLESILVENGLYPDEAHAMLETWRSTWFEEGSRLFYIVPPCFVDNILPLTITPSPAQTVRVFVGRLEIVSPATQKAVQAALASNDQATLAKYSRFLEPIQAVIKTRNSASPQTTRSGDATSGVGVAKTH